MRGSPGNVAVVSGNGDPIACKTSIPPPPFKLQFFPGDLARRLARNGQEMATDVALHGQSYGEAAWAAFPPLGFAAVVLARPQQGKRIANADASISGAIAAFLRGNGALKSSCHRVRRLLRQFAKPENPARIAGATLVST